MPHQLIAAGTTTLVGGVLFSVETPGDAKYAFVFANVGDCKVFHYDAKRGTVVDLTEANRVTDASDPGGRLGPYINEKDPGMDSFFLFFISSLSPFPFRFFSFKSFMYRYTIHFSEW